MAEPEGLSGLKLQRRAKILDAAQNLFVLQGYRATTMEGIANAVGMSKVTVYGYFKDKDEVFSAVGTRLGMRMRDEVFEELGNGRSVKIQIATALGRKHGLIFETVRHSPFSSELFTANANLLAGVFKTIDAEIIARMAERIETTGLDSAAAQRKAELIFNAAQGIANASPALSNALENIGELVEALLA